MAVVMQNIEDFYTCTSVELVSLKEFSRSHHTFVQLLWKYDQSRTALYSSSADSIPNISILVKT